MLDLPALPSGSRRRETAARHRRAFSLLEVIVGMSLFTLTAMGVLALTFMVRSTSERAVYNNTALTLAQAYLEQLRSIDYGTLRSAANDAAQTAAQATHESALQHVAAAQRRGRPADDGASGDSCCRAT